jgi:L-iditol 2-dehydrogenase
MTVIEEIPPLDIADDEVLIQVKYVGICGSDLHIFKGKHPFRKPPVVPGHELVGIIVKTGLKVSKFAVGELVTLLPMVSCGSCPDCLSGRENHCRNNIVPGTAAWSGAMVEYLNAKERIAFSVPSNVTPEAAVLAEPLSIAIHALRQVPNAMEKSLLILGAGSIGLLCLFAAKKMGFGRVAITDIVEFNLAKAYDLNADLAKDVSNKENKGITRLDGAPYDAVIIAASSPEVFAQAFENAGVQATVVYVSMITDPLSISTRPIVEKELRIIGSRRCLKTDFEDALTMIATDASLYANLVTHRFDCHECQKAFEMMAGQTEGFVKVLIDMHSD